MPRLQCRRRQDARAHSRTRPPLLLLSKSRWRHSRARPAHYGREAAGCRRVSSFRMRGRGSQLPPAPRRQRRSLNLLKRTSDLIGSGSKPTKDFDKGKFADSLKYSGEVKELTEPVAQRHRIGTKRGKLYLPICPPDVEPVCWAEFHEGKLRLPDEWLSAKAAPGKVVQFPKRALSSFGSFFIARLDRVTIHSVQCLRRLHISILAVRYEYMKCIYIGFAVLLALTLFLLITGIISDIQINGWHGLQLQ